MQVPECGNITQSWFTWWLDPARYLRVTVGWGKYYVRLRWHPSWKLFIERW